MIDYYPPWGFYYKVEFSISKNKDDVRFQTVSGLSVEYDMEEYKEGGENRFTHKLPGRTKYADLILKRGMLTDSQVINWFFDAFNNRNFRIPKVIHDVIIPSITVTLMNESGQSLRTWNIVRAIPKKWTVSDFNSGESSIVIETMELTYSYFTIVKDKK